MAMNDFVIISDLHLGSHVCRSDLLIEFLDTWLDIDTPGV